MTVGLALALFYGLCAMIGAISGIAFVQGLR